MPNIQKIGGFAAIANVLVDVAMLFVALVLIGPAALSDNNIFIEMALHNPAPLFWQDFLKLISATLALMIVLALFNRLKSKNHRLVLTGTLFGIIAIIVLLINAALSFFSVTFASSLGPDASSVIGILGIISIATNGVWYLLENWAARKSGLLPIRLTTLGLVIGAISLVPPFAIFVLLLSMVWSGWLGMVLLRND